MVAKSDEIDEKVILGSGKAIQALVSNMHSSAQGLAPAADWTELRMQVPEIINTSVQEIRSLLAGRDLWDILAALRQFIAPGDLSVHKESENTSFLAAVEVVALVGLSESSKTENLPRDLNEEAGEIIPKVYESAARIIQLALMLGFADSDTSPASPSSELGALLRNHELAVRGRNYLSTSRSISGDLFNHAVIEKLLRENLGFTHSDFVAVWDAIQSLLTRRHNERLQRFGEIAIQSQSTGNSSAADIAEGRELVRLLFSEPRHNISFSVSDIASESDLGLEVVEAVLAKFSVLSTGMNATAAVQKFVNGRNLLAGKGLIKGQEDTYLVIGDPLPHDYLRSVIESHLKSSPKKWQQYQRHRDSWTERIASELVAQLFDQVEPTYSSLEYWAPKSDDVSHLSKDSPDFKEQSLLTEADALLVLDDVAICIEVKAGSITERARTGDPVRIETDVKKTIGSATSQATRLRRLIEENGGLRKANGKWLDLSEVREVHSIVVCLDDWGPLAIATDALVRSGFISYNSIPWLVSVHDLYVIRDLGIRPADFLTYLRRRTDPLSAHLFVATDELDLLMWHLNGGFYFEPDPEIVHSRNPASSPPSISERRRYKASNVRTRISTLTDPLDAWIYFREGQSSVPAEKPERKNLPAVEGLLTFLQDGHKPGWLRFGADLAGLSEAAQRAVATNLKHALRLTRKDHQSHTYAQSHVDQWGHGLFIIGTKPKSYSVEDSRKRIEKYVDAKKYQLQADRALALVIDESSKVVSVIYRSGQFESSDEMDALVKGLGLKDLARSSNSIPPSARRSTVRLPRKSKRKKRR